MITLGVLLIVLYFLFRHPALWVLGVLLVTLGAVLLISAGAHYAYY